MQPVRSGSLQPVCCVQSVLRRSLQPVCLLTRRAFPIFSEDAASREAAFLRSAPRLSPPWGPHAGVRKRSAGTRAAGAALRRAFPRGDHERGGTDDADRPDVCLEQSRIPGFEQLGAADRRREVHRYSTNEPSRLARPAQRVLLRHPSDPRERLLQAGLPNYAVPPLMEARMIRSASSGEKPIRRLKASQASWASRPLAISSSVGQ